jgi:hypothetical protein
MVVLIQFREVVFETEGLVEGGLVGKEKKDGV